MQNKLERLSLAIIFSLVLFLFERQDAPLGDQKVFLKQQKFGSPFPGKGIVSSLIQNFTFVKFELD
jgi:hypothetical protein